MLKVLKCCFEVEASLELHHKQHQEPPKMLSSFVVEYFAGLEFAEGALVVQEA